MLPANSRDLSALPPAGVLRRCPGERSHGLFPGRSHGPLFCSSPTLPWSRLEMSHPRQILVRGVVLRGNLVERGQPATFSLSAGRAVEIIHSSRHSSLSKRDPCLFESHFHAAEGTAEHQVVKAAQVPNPKDLVRQFAQTRTKRQVKVFQDDLAQLNLGVTVWQKHGGKRVTIFARIQADQLEAPGAHGLSSRFPVPGVPPE